MFGIAVRREYEWFVKLGSYEILEVAKSTKAKEYSKLRSGDKVEVDYHFERRANKSVTPIVDVKFIFSDGTIIKSLRRMTLRQLACIMINFKTRLLTETRELQI